MKTQKNISAVILAAGNSSRMKFPKPFLPFDESRNFIEKIMDDHIHAGTGRIILVINTEMERQMRLIISANYRAHHIEIVLNRFPERGRFYSIRLGLALVNERYCFLQNCDNPFSSVELLDAMVQAAPDSGYVVPSFRGKEGHPLLLCRDVKGYLSGLLGDEYNLRNELVRFNKTILDWTDKSILANINTREEYRKYFLTYESSY